MAHGSGCSLAKLLGDLPEVFADGEGRHLSPQEQGHQS